MLARKMNTLGKFTIKIFLIATLLIAMVSTIFHASQSFSDLDHKNSCEVCAAYQGISSIVKFVSVLVALILVAAQAEIKGIGSQHFSSISVRRLSFGLDPPALSVAA